MRREKVNDQTKSQKQENENKQIKQKDSKIGQLVTNIINKQLNKKQNNKIENEVLALNKNNPDSDQISHQIIISSQKAVYQAENQNNKTIQNEKNENIVIILNKKDEDNEKIEIEEENESNEKAQGQQNSQKCHRSIENKIQLEDNNTNENLISSPQNKEIDKELIKINISDSNQVNNLRIFNYQQKEMNQKENKNNEIIHKEEGEQKYQLEIDQENQDGSNKRIKQQQNKQTQEILKNQEFHQKIEHEIPLENDNSNKKLNSSLETKVMDKELINNNNSDFYQINNPQNIDAQKIVSQLIEKIKNRKNFNEENKQTQEILKNQECHQKIEHEIKLENDNSNKKLNSSPVNKVIKKGLINDSFQDSHQAKNNNILIILNEDNESIEIEKENRDNKKAQKQQNSQKYHHQIENKIQPEDNNTQESLNSSPVSKVIDKKLTNASIKKSSEYPSCSQQTISIFHNCDNCYKNKQQKYNLKDKNYHKAKRNKVLINQGENNHETKLQTKTKKIQKQNCNNTDQSNKRQCQKCRENFEEHNTKYKRCLKCRNAQKQYTKDWSKKMTQEAIRFNQENQYQSKCQKCFKTYDLLQAEQQIFALTKEKYHTKTCKECKQKAINYQNKKLKQ